MASIALIGTDIAHNAVTSCRDALVALSHTVTLVSEANVGSTDFSSFDLIVTSRTSSAAQSTLAGQLNTLNTTNNKPLIIGPLESGQAATASVSGLLTLMGLSGNIAVDSNQTQQEILGSAHPITDNDMTQTATMFGAGNWVGAVASGQTHLGTAFLRGAAGLVNGLVTGFAVPPATARLTSGSTGARIVVYPTYLISGSYGSKHQELLGHSVEWALTGAVVYPTDLRVSAAEAYVAASPDTDLVLVTASEAYVALGVEASQVYVSKSEVYIALTTNEPAPPFVVGATASVSAGAFTPEPASRAYQWRRDGVVISGATASSYVLAEADIGAMIDCVVLGLNSFGEASLPAVAAAVGPVVAA